MEDLPEVIQTMIHKYAHEIDFSKSIALLKRIKVESNECDIIELKMSDDFEPIEREVDDEVSSDAGTTDTDTLEEIVEDIEELMNPGASRYREQMEYYFVDARNLTLDMSIRDQMQIVSENENIWIDLGCDYDYWFDEHFFDISMRKYGDDIWLKIQKKLNITIHNFELSRSPICNKHKRYNELWLTYHDPLPIRACDIIYLIEEMNIKALYDHTYIENISNPGHGRWIDKNGVTYTCISIDFGS